MKPKFVFLIGNPGAGKSTFYKMLSSKLRQENIISCRINDREFFWKAIHHDVQQKYHRIQEDGLVDVFDLGLYDIQYKLLNQSLISSNYQCHFVFVEFTSPSYQKFIQSFDTDFISKSYLILFLTSFNTGAYRNRLRNIRSEDLDNCQVPESYLSQCYHQDFNLSDLKKYFYKTLTISNDTFNISDLENNLPIAISFLFDIIEAF